jgi:hypothetical protein
VTEGPKHGGARAAGLRRAAATVTVVLLLGLAHAWTPEDFATYCGRPAYVVADDPARARATWYAAQAADPDAPSGPGCAALEQRGWLEDALRDALRRLRAEPFAVSPAPTRLGPVFDRHTGAAAVRVFVYGGVGIAETFACASRVRDALGVLQFDGERLSAMSLVSVAYVAAHELVHVLQEPQALHMGAPCTTETRVPLWVSEGIADAFATLWIREQFPSFRPPTATGLGRNLLGLRSFAVSLAAPDGQDARTQLYSYRASALFRFVAERWHAGDHALWATAMASPAPAGNDALAWMDARLRSADLGVRQPLALVFPSFLASYAGWGRSDGDRWPHVGEAAWRRLAFGACEQVVLSPATPAVTRGFALEPISGNCVEIRIEGVPADRVVSVETVARNRRLEQVDDLHLAGVAMGLPPLDGGPSTCVEVERRAPLALPACVAKAITAVRTDAAGAEVWARTFQAAAVRSRGGPWTDVLVLARVPARPSDATDAHRRLKDYAVTFALQFAALTTDGRDAGPVQSAANQRAPGHSGLATDAGQGSSSDPSRLLFGQVAPGGVAMSQLVPGAGIYLLQFVEGDDVDGDDVGRGFSVSFGANAIPPRTTGTFTGVLSGTDPSRSGLAGAIVDAGGDTPSARVTVLSWDEEMVHLRVDGAWCYASELRPEGRGCRERRDFAAEVWLPFGDAYDTDHPYRSVDSPVQALYREAFARATGFGPGVSLVPPTAATSPADPATPAPGANASGAFACDCSCAGATALEARAAEIARSGGVTPAAIATLTQCALTCAPAWARCED